MRHAIYPHPQSQDWFHTGLKWSLSVLAAILAVSLVLVLETSN